MTNSFWLEQDMLSQTEKMVILTLGVGPWDEMKDVGHLPEPWYFMV